MDRIAKSGGVSSASTYLREYDDREEFELPCPRFIAPSSTPLPSRLVYARPP